ncbi:SDR family NAD(P)-dependent oxidoreductase [Rhizosaccharibacter radicis]|uniref:SDR family NAD(P)-dependent oxidoreductase n=1 Tax=Rhizosaccharibacter radicis TaxID=2782605 RepID=A0ABT1VVG9_9PROT|nr:SDR family NAD(P)-dependent oxidoreductase [Acetobacteraceae bacterium KSS12]
MAGSSETPHLLVFGLGYCARALAVMAVGAGWRVTGTSRRPDAAPPVSGVRIVGPSEGALMAGDVTHLLSSVPPDADGDPVLRLLGPRPLIPALRWVGYFSTTGVYGDRNGDWVDENTPAAPGGERGRRRLAAERDWVDAAGVVPIDLLRIAGIYGPARSPFDALRRGEAKRVAAPGRLFGRIHRDDVAGATFQAMRQCCDGSWRQDAPPREPARVRVLNLSDDLPAESAAVTAEAASLLGVVPPDPVPLEEALRTMSPMGRSFWAEDRKVRSVLTCRRLGRPWRYPTYREGLRAILEAETAEG